MKRERETDSMPLTEQTKRGENVAKKRDRYIVIDDRKIFLSIERLLSVIEVCMQDKSTSLILVKVKDNKYISIFSKN